VGREQAERLAHRVATDEELTGCDALLSSPLLRARQTVEILRSALPRRPIVEEPRLKEFDPGAADGLEWHDYVAKYGAFDMVAHPTRPFAPGGESWHDFANRVRTVLGHLAQQYQDQTILAVTHSGVIVLSLIVLFDIPRPGTGARLEPRHTALTEWRTSQGTWHLVRYNDAAHLTVGGPV